MIAANGTLGGYGGGLDRKEWLLRHEGDRARSAVTETRPRIATLRRCLAVD